MVKTEDWEMEALKPRDWDMETELKREGAG